MRSEEKSIKNSVDLRNSSLHLKRLRSSYLWNIMRSKDNGYKMAIATSSTEERALEMTV